MYTPDIRKLDLYTLNAVTLMLRDYEESAVKALQRVYPTSHVTQGAAAALDSIFALLEVTRGAVLAREVVKEACEQVSEEGSKLGARKLY